MKRPSKGLHDAPKVVLLSPSHVRGFNKPPSKGIFEAPKGLYEAPKQRALWRTCISGNKYAARDILKLDFFFKKVFVAYLSISLPVHLYI